MSLIHSFSPTELADITLPQTFNDPFHYTPHPLCRRAASCVLADVAACPAWRQELEQGKMLGVAVVQTQRGGIGFLAAYSGLAHLEDGAAYFVPPVYDLTRPAAFYEKEDAEISALNREIASLEENPTWTAAQEAERQKRQAAERQIEAWRAQMADAKRRRDERRGDPSIGRDEAEALIRESQYQKAELKRRKARLQAEIDQAEAALRPVRERLRLLKEERRQRSLRLQQKIFDQFRFLNAQGETKSLQALFAPLRQPLPPAGAGECAGPRLLQYAYRHRLRPLAMAEFWYGAPTADGTRRHGLFYPACTEKCGPILPFMLRGLPLSGALSDPTATEAAPLTILYEDEWLMAVDKPAGMLAVPGRTGAISVVERLRQMAGGGERLPVHRLDMATSGLMLVAKDRRTQSLMHRLFATRRVEKTYIACLEGDLRSHCGVIRLAIRPDVSRRPLQVIDEADGRKAMTVYEVLRRDGGWTWVKLSPLTGRTHQLRLHAADRRSLAIPICGDPLYGHCTHNDIHHDTRDNARPVASRLFLYAARLRFVHPVTHRQIDIHAASPFSGDIIRG